MFTIATSQRGVPGRITHIPYLYYRYASDDGGAGHVRLFGKPMRCTVVYQWHSFPAEWAMTRTWRLLGLVSLTHIGPGKATRRNGWHFRVASIRIGRVCGGFAVTFRRAEVIY